MARISLRALTPLLLATAIVAASSYRGTAQERQRSEIPTQYTWNLADIYPSVDAWRAAKDQTAGDIPRLKQFAGRLASSASTLADALETSTAVGRSLRRVGAYASLLADQDSREAAPKGMQQEITRFGTQLASEAAYIDPEILAFPPGTVARFVADEPRLRPYAFRLNDLERRRAHLLSQPEEQILALVGPTAGASSDIFTTLLNADLPTPTVRLADGQSVKVTQANYALHRTSTNRSDRQTVMTAFLQSLASFSRTFGATMNGNLQRWLLASKARRYATTLEATLDRPNIPVAVYSRLVDSVGRQLPTLHRYLRLRKQMLGVDDPAYHDLYAPLMNSVDVTYSPEEAQRLVLAAMAPLGVDYRSSLTRALNDRWIDFFPTPGKVFGAYSTSIGPDVHPYMLMNFNGGFRDVSTLAHELGHAMHSYYSNKTQPYPMTGYPTFVAEVASTFNEVLLIDHMLKTVTDDSLRLSLLGNYLDNIRSTVFRQTQFAEFELAMHEMAAAGQPITGESLSKKYLEITRKYYGHAQGVTAVNDDVGHEWSFVPHFYTSFYVFQYATSFTAAASLADKVETGDPAATARYIAFISAGGSKYPIDLLKDAGIDMTTDEPLTLTMKKMNAAMDQMEAILAKRR